MEKRTPKSKEIVSIFRVLRPFGHYSFIHATKCHDAVPHQIKWSLFETKQLMSDYFSIEKCLSSGVTKYDMAIATAASDKEC